jgi:hypothetical protein
MEDGEQDTDTEVIVGLDGGGVPLPLPPPQPNESNVAKTAMLALQNLRNGRATLVTDSIVSSLSGGG